MFRRTVSGVALLPLLRCPQEQIDVFPERAGFVLGLAPVIYGIGGYEPFVAPAAIVLAYGLVFATFLTLLVVPCMYSIGADLKAWVIRLRNR